MLNLKSRTEQLDYDYTDKLTPEQKLWLADFTEEYVHANLKHRGKIFHRTKRLRKDCYDRNNARNRDILTRAKASGKMSDYDPSSQADIGVSGEDELIALIDLKRRLLGKP